ncbi:MAG: exodeoxyribonuclease VII large subunit [Bacteroidales bacterium]|nr:exodeoxyribonuclease VII large subunit [Candidatus Physcousia equi]
MQSLSLYQLNNLISQTIEQQLPDEVWVKGELAEGRPASGGHFYGELIERSEDKGAIRARARITIWARSYNLIRYRFERETGQRLLPGINLLLCVRITFHEAYGYSLNVVDIDPSFTLGKTEQRRRQIIAQLEEDGIIDDNRTLPLPLLMSRIAVISSEHAAGYGDFCKQLVFNDYHLHFDIKLFPALMQGERVEQTVLSALENILHDNETPFCDKPSFDVVVIIRGGGAVSDLSDFDSYPLAAAIAQYPIPVFTGIGHDRDETVLDRVACLSLKTPTAVASFIIDHQAEQLARLERLQQRLTHTAQRTLDRAHQHLEHLASTLPLLFAHVRQREDAKLLAMQDRLAHAARLHLEREKHRLSLLEQRATALDPKLLLRRGYSMTMLNGKIITSAQQLQKGDRIQTILADGSRSSVIE